MKHTFTPGPWQCYADLPSTDENWYIVTSENRMRVVANVHIEPGNPTDAANARLIAAAPELLEALQGIMDLYVPTKDVNSVATAARAAIAKATGEE